MNGNDDNTFDDELMARAAKLATEVKPDRDLWPGIEQAIGEPVRSTPSVWNSVWAQAAAVVLLVGGSSGITYMAVNDGGDPTVPVVGTQTLVFEPVSGSFGSQYNLGPGYQDARRVLVAKVDDELDNMAPETRADVVTSLETIRQAINDLNKALAEEPDNVLLQELLLDTYRYELSLMNKVDGITRSAMRRGDI
jgi:hypothetical protein